MVSRPVINISDVHRGCPQWEISSPNCLEPTLDRGKQIENIEEGRTQDIIKDPKISEYFRDLPSGKIFARRLRQSEKCFDREEDISVDQWNNKLKNNIAYYRVWSTNNDYRPLNDNEEKGFGQDYGDIEQCKEIFKAADISLLKSLDTKSQIIFKFKKIIEYMAAKRAVACTMNNPDSSRSIAIMICRFCSRHESTCQCDECKQGDIVAADDDDSGPVSTERPKYDPGTLPRGLLGRDNPKCRTHTTQSPHKSIVCTECGCCGATGCECKCPGVSASGTIQGGGKKVEDNIVQYGGIAEVKNCMSQLWVIDCAGDELEVNSFLKSDNTEGSRRKTINQNLKGLSQSTLTIGQQKTLKRVIYECMMKYNKYLWEKKREPQKMTEYEDDRENELLYKCVLCKGDGFTQEIDGLLKLDEGEEDEEGEEEFDKTKGEGTENEMLEHMNMCWMKCAEKLFIERWNDIEICWENFYTTMGTSTLEIERIMNGVNPGFIDDQTRFINNDGYELKIIGDKEISFTDDQRDLININRKFVIEMGYHKCLKINKILEPIRLEDFEINIQRLKKEKKQLSTSEADIQRKENIEKMITYLTLFTMKLNNSFKTEEEINKNLEEIFNIEHKGEEESCSYFDACDLNLKTTNMLESNNRAISLVYTTPLTAFVQKSTTFLLSLMTNSLDVNEKKYYLL